MGQAFNDLTGKESNPDTKGRAMPVFKMTPSTKNAYFMPGADPGEGYSARTIGGIYASDWRLGCEASESASPSAPRGNIADSVTCWALSS